MKITVPDNLNANEFPGENENFYRLLDYFVQHRFETVQLARNNITLEDNAYIQVVEYKFSHGQKVLFANTLPGKTKPRAIIPVFSDGYMIDSWQMSFERGGQIGITLKFDNPDSYISLRRSNNVSVVDGDLVAVEWDVVAESLGDGLEFISPTQVICRKPGRYCFSYDAAWDYNNTGHRESFLAKNANTTGTMSRFAYNSLPTNQNQDYCATGTYTFNLIENDYIELYVLQSSGGSLDYLGNNEYEVHLQANSVHYAPNNVNCILYVLG